MPWFRLDDDFHNHPKVRAAGNAATGLWVRCGTYSAHYLTDGHIDTAIAHSYGTDPQINRLVNTRLWIPDDNGFLIPDYLDYNPSQKQVADDREKLENEERNRGSVPGHDHLSRIMYIFPDPTRKNAYTSRVYMSSRDMSPATRRLK